MTVDETNPAKEQALRGFRFPSVLRAGLEAAARARRATGRLLVFLRPYKARFLLSLLALMTASALGLAFPYLVGKLIDSALSTGFDQESRALMGEVNQIALILVAIMAVQAVCSYWHFNGFSQIGERCLVDLRKTTFSRLVCLPLAFFSKRRTGELTNRLSADLSQMQDFFSTTVPGAFREAMVLLGGVVLIGVTSLKLTLVMLLMVPVLVVVAEVFGRRIRRSYRAAQDKLAETGVVAEETLQGIVNVKAFTNEHYEIKRYGSTLDFFLGAVLQGARHRAAFAAFILFAIFSAIVGVLWYGARMMALGQITAGELTRFILYTGFIAGSVGTSASLYGQFQRAIGATRRVLDLLEEPGEAVQATPQPRVKPSSRLRGEVCFENVNFRYPDRPGVLVLNHLNLKVSPGERIALVGQSGAGKSTIAALLLRLHEPESGRLLVDGRDARDYPLTELRSQMAVVPQEVLLFGGSIAENIAYGKPGASVEEIIEAARRAHAHEFIAALPEGYKTMVGDRGIKVSGGQRQRIAIARAILRDPAILILDEATSALDSESERLVQEAMESLMRQRTTFIIAHRLSTVRNADKIAVIDKGRIVEFGPPGELLQRENGLYRALLAMQFEQSSER